MRIRVLVVDDHAMLREAVGALLAAHDDVEVVGEAANGREAIAKVNELAPDVVLMDIALPLMDGLEATRRILKRRPETRVLILSQYNDREHVLSSLKAGAAGYLPKGTMSSELISAIRTINRGDSFLHPSALTILINEQAQKAEREPYDELTEREREVLKLVVEGHTSQEVARLLGTSVKTILHHKMNTMRKLDIHSHVELVKYAVRNRLTGVETLSADE